MAIVRVPDNGSDWQLTLATWGLAGATIILCAITGLGVRKQGRDMQRSVEAAETSAAAAAKSATAAADAVEAAARRRREDLEREVNLAAHRVKSTAARVYELAKEVPAAAKTLFALAGRNVEAAALFERVMEVRQEAATAAVSSGALMLGMLQRKDPDSELIAGLHEMDRRLVVIELMKEDITRQLEGLNSQIEQQRQMNETHRQHTAGNLGPVFPPSITP